MKRLIYGLIIIFSIFISTNYIKAWSEYKIGDKVTYNDIDFYVIKDSSSTDESLTMLKAEPLTVEEVNLYGGVGTEHNHVNMNVPPSNSSYQRAYDRSGYGGMQYYSSTNCNLVTPWLNNNCKNEYKESEVKYVVDAWAEDKLSVDDLIVDSEGYTVRLLTADELINYLGYGLVAVASYYPKITGDTPEWVYNAKYYQWTMSEYSDNIADVFGILSSGALFGHASVYDNEYTVRPVITLSKTALGDIDESIIDEENNETKANDNATTNTKDINTITKVNVPNTYLTSSIIIIMSGLILAVCGIVLYYIKTKNKE